MDTTENCCEAWVANRPYLKWYEFDDEPDVFAMPCVPRTNFRVNYCPVCGGERRSTIWNRNTHPTLGDGD